MDKLIRRTKHQIEYEQTQAATCGVPLSIFRRLKTINRDFETVRLLPFSECQKMLGFCRQTSGRILNSFASNGLKIYRTSKKNAGRRYVKEDEFKKYLTDFLENQKYLREQSILQTDSKEPIHA